MTKDIIEEIKQALASAPRNRYMAELHLQSIKYADELSNITAREFCEELGLKPSYATEFSKMRNLTSRLKAAGLDTRKI
ncbi:MULTISPECIES: HTH-like domain-containing protein [unclassified Colwellia]|uniref:HTH-like domain-containing protein n=1 Tax=unclassified Colwellia TaxID=196834 RepID=UPI0015F5BBE0|nr:MULTISPECIES: transcription factor [unclassified Colwellia]MBA6233971.1 transcription factor [Colwellia sp. MB02u-7]MBA6236965.1 transcription factor [Colwellia sp. MB02u-11]MBA6300645.1 transcription factor [Colwellia sp. MB3u-22]MBA6310596.1 transcription factor [Colwellia sp. MB3u-64]